VRWLHKRIEDDPAESSRIIFETPVAISSPGGKVLGKSGEG
jgi:hypothetical protein